MEVLKVFSSWNIQNWWDTAKEAPRIMKSQNKYEVMGTLGKGGFATVISVRDTVGKSYALKKPFHVKEFLDTSTGIINMKEVYIMSCIKHPYIQRADIVFFEDPCPIDHIFLDPNQGYDRVFFLMAQADYSCHELVHKFRAPISHIKRAMFQATCAIQYLHSQGICHRDVKPGNLLCRYGGENGGVLTVKLTDFGMTKPMNNVNRHSLHAGTSWYRAPELILQNKDYGLSMDIWSLGATFYEMVCRKSPFEAKTDMEVLDKIFSRRGTPDPKTMAKIAPKSERIKLVVTKHRPKTMRSQLILSPNDCLLFNEAISNNMHNPGTLDEFCDLLHKTLQIDPEHRPTIDEVLKHPFFAGFMTPHEKDFGLWRPSLKDLDPEYRREKTLDLIQFYPSNHPPQYVDAGAKEFVEIYMDNDRYDEELQYTVRFHGLDVFYRLLLKVEPMNDIIAYKKLAWCSGYMVSKFYLDEASEHLLDIFPLSIDHIQVPEITSLERKILQLLEFEVYRPTFFTFLEHRSFYAALFALTLRGDLMFNKPIRKVMEIVNAEIIEIKKANPNIIIPLE